MCAYSKTTARREVKWSCLLVDTSVIYTHFWSSHELPPGCSFMEIRYAKRNRGLEARLYPWHVKREYFLSWNYGVMPLRHFLFLFPGLYFLLTVTHHPRPQQEFIRCLWLQPLQVAPKSPNPDIIGFGSPWHESIFHSSSMWNLLLIIFHVMV